MMSAQNSPAHDKSAFAIIDPFYATSDQRTSPMSPADLRYWAYGEAELECWRLTVLRQRCQAAKLIVGYPGVFHTPATHVFFRHAWEAAPACRLAIRAVGKLTVRINDVNLCQFPAQDQPHRVVLPAAPRDDERLTIELDAPEDLPCFRIDGGAWSTATAGWEWSCDGVAWAAARSFPEQAPDVPPHHDMTQEALLSPCAREGVLFDFGREIFGYVRIRSRGKPGLFVGESQAEALNASPAAFEQSLAIRATDDDAWESEAPLAFRYARVEGHEPEPLTCRTLFHPVQYRGAFACSNDNLTRIWMHSAYTLRLCLQDFIIDGLKRDRLPWVGDLVMSMLVDAYTFGEAEIVRRTLTALGRAGIAKTHLNGIIDYSLWWLIAQDQFQLYFGDPEHLRREWPRIEDAAERLSAACDADGFLLVDPGTWLFIDWVEGAKNTALQMLWVWAQRSCAHLARRMGKEDLAVRCSQRADALAARLRTSAWDPERGVWLDEPHGASVPSRHATMFSVIADVALPAQSAAIRERLLNPSLPPVGTPYMAGFECLALARLGAVGDMLSRIDTCWGAMLKLGASSFWEAFEARSQGDAHYGFYGRPFGKSLCHAWSAGPAAILPQALFGLVPLEDSWRVFTVEPRLGPLSWACATVPTPHGDITLAADAGRRMQLTVPAGAAALWRGQTITGSYEARL